MPVSTLPILIRRYDGHVAIACDTEFQGSHTLTRQFATRLGEEIVVQVYSNPAIPGLPDADKLLPLLQPLLEKTGVRVVLRDGHRITADLSLAHIVADLFGLRGAEAHTRFTVQHSPHLEVGEPLTVTLVAHFWTADFFRIFGQEFFSSLLGERRRGGGLVVQAHKLLSFREVDSEHKTFRRSDPVLEYVWHRDCYYLLRVRYFDTCLPFGWAKLDELANTFAGVGELAGFGPEQKADMLQTFRQDTDRAYAYAVQDAVVTLLVQEEMVATHRQMYRDLDFADADIPPLRATQGRRVADTVLQCLARDAAGAAALSCKGQVSLTKVKRLLRKGSAAYLAQEHLSRFGEQTGQTHGGLLFSRSPTQLFHAAPGQFHDVDLSGCYAHVLQSMAVYAGRPVVLRVRSPTSPGPSTN